MVGMKIELPDGATIEYLTPLATIPAGGVVPLHSHAAPETFFAISDRYGYWNATPEENAEIGITVPAPAHP